MPLETPAPDFGHLYSMTDERGTFEHALFSEPRPEHGYCTDDMARVLVVATREGSNASAMRSSPQVGFSRSIWRMMARMFFGSAGRPRFRDFQRQKNRNAVRCHLRNVSGLTTTSASRQLRNCASASSVIRPAAVIRRGLVSRS